MEDGKVIEGNFDPIKSDGPEPVLDMSQNVPDKTVVLSVEDRLTRLEELPDTQAILAATAEIHAAHEQFTNTTRSLQERMIDTAQIKQAIDVIRNRCNNIMQIAPSIENLLSLQHSFAARLGGKLVAVEGVYVFQLNQIANKKKAAKAKRK